MTAAATLTEARDSDSSDSDDKREGDRSPSEDEFLSCDSSSDRGEGDGQGRGGGSAQAEAEPLSPDEAGRAISEKERRKDRKFSWGQQRTSSEQVDEDADVDTAMAALGPQPAEAQPPSPRPSSPCRTPGARQPCPSSTDPAGRQHAAARPAPPAPRGGFPPRDPASGGETGRTCPHSLSRWSWSGVQGRPGAPSPRPELKCVGRAGTGDTRWARASAPSRGAGGLLPGLAPELAWLPRPSTVPLCPQSRTTRPTCAAPRAPAAPCTTARATPSWPAARPAPAPRGWGRPMCSRKVRRAGQRGLPSWARAGLGVHGCHCRAPPRTAPLNPLTPLGAMGEPHLTDRARGPSHVTHPDPTLVLARQAPGPPPAGGPAGRGPVLCCVPSPGAERRQPAAEGAVLPQRHLRHLRRLHPQPRAVSHL